MHLPDDWDRIVSQHAVTVWRAAYRIVGNSADADECMQEAFMDAVRLERRDTVRNWGGLLHRLATRRALDCLRRRMAGNRRFAGGFDHDTLPAASDPPDSRMQHDELASRLRLALGRLPTLQAEVFCLRHAEGMSYEEIADQLQVSANSIGAILHRARKTLRELLSDPSSEQ